MHGYVLFVQNIRVLEISCTGVYKIQNDFSFFFCCFLLYTAGGEMKMTNVAYA